MTGRSISHYEILEKLGAGGMGEIYKARDPRLNRTVAIKILPAGSAGDPERRRRFLQEAQAASGLNHPNIIVIHDILSDGDSDYMVMEFVAGKTLGDLIPQSGLGVAKTLQYSVQIADALAAAHAAGIIHRDLKPGNVMVTDGRIKVLDFGLAKVTAMTSLTEETQTVGAPMTVEGSILGTVSYMSPEQAQGKRVDARSDIFAFGALLYEMITGQKAFGGDSAIITLTAILRDEVKPIAHYLPGIPPELEEIIGRALRKDPAQRWQSMQDVHGVLAALRQKFESGILDATQIILSPAKKRKLSPWAIVGLSFGIMTSIGGWWMTTQRLRPRVPRPEPPAAAAPAPVPLAKGDKPSPLEAPASAPVKKDDGTLTNDAILDMVHAKVAEPVIVSHIRAAPKTRFDLSTPEIIRLTKEGVGPDVIEAMRSPGAPPPTPKAVETRAVTVSAGLPVTITLLADVPNDPEPGMPLRFQVKQPLVVEGATVIGPGATVTGEIAGVKKGILGRGGKQMFRLLTVTAIDGSSVKLRAAVGKNADRSEQPIEPPGRRDKGLLAPAGSTYIGYIDGVHTVQVKK